MRDHLVILGAGAIILAIAAWSAVSWTGGRPPAVPSSSSADGTVDAYVEPDIVPPYDPVDADQLDAMLSSGMDVLLVDVRVPEEPHIPGTDLVVAMEDLTASSELSADLVRPIVVYGATGKEGREAAKLLYDAGHENIYDLSGGAIAWELGGRALEPVR